MNRVLQRNAWIIGLCFVVAVGCTAVLLVIVYYVRSVDQQDAQQAAQKLSADVRSSLTSTNGFMILKEGKPGVREISDEMGGQDYMLSSAFLVHRSVTSEILPDMEAEAFALSKQVRTSDYPIEVENAPQTAARPGLLCVYAERYLNNDGSYIPQGTAKQSTLFIPQAKFDEGYVSPCAELLK